MVVAAEPKSHAHLRPVSVSSEQMERRLHIEWSDGRLSRFPYIWLRHDCFFPIQGRPEQADDALPLQPESPDRLKVCALEWDDTRITLTWSHDGSTTQHDVDDLRQRCISDEGRAERSPPAETWAAKDASEFVWFTARSVDHPDSRLSIFEHLLTRGIAFVRDCPITREALIEFADRFGPVRRTHFGEVFDIRSTPNDNRGTGESIGATACNTQAPHMDESFRHGQPGISFFHCIKAHPGGQGSSIFLDGFKAAERLREENPKSFEILTTTPMMFRAERNVEERFRSWKRMIATDHDGIVRGISVSDRTFPPLNLPEEMIETAYRSIGAFHEQLARPDLMYKRVLQPGEMVIFDNHRVLHARLAFDPMAGERHLQQLSVDREEFHNLMRQLAEKCGRADLANLDTDSGVLSQR